MRRMEFLGQKPILLNWISKVAFSIKLVTNTLLEKTQLTGQWQDTLAPVS